MWLSAFLLMLHLSSAPPAADYSLDRRTVKSVREFATCFVAAQGAAGNAWWFVPDDQGGVLSNAGAGNVDNSHRLRLVDHGAFRTLRVEAATPSRPPAPPVADAIDHCI